MPYRKVGELSSVDLRFDPDESENYDLYPGRPMHQDESLGAPIDRVPRGARRPPPQTHAPEGAGHPSIEDDPEEVHETPLASSYPTEESVQTERPIDFGKPAPPPTRPPPPASEESSSVLPVVAVLLIVGIGGYLIYRSVNKNRF